MKYELNRPTIETIFCFMLIFLCFVKVNFNFIGLWMLKPLKGQGTTTSLDINHDRRGRLWFSVTKRDEGDVYNTEEDIQDFSRKGGLPHTSSMTVLLQRESSSTVMQTCWLLYKHQPVNWIGGIIDSRPNLIKHYADIYIYISPNLQYQKGYLSPVWEELNP